MKPILVILAALVVLAGCSSSDSTPASTGLTPASPAAAPNERPAEVVVKEKTIAFRANTTPLIRREAEFTAGCWAASKPFFELAGDSDSSTAGGDVTVTVTGDTAVASYVDSDGKQQSEKWRLVAGDWLVDCP